MEKNDTISILYVEDQDDVRLFLSKILSRHYKNVYLAANGKEGLELYYQHKPDIIISDIKMPVMDGLSMSTKIKETDPNAKIILTTAHSDMEYFIQSIEIGINQYILKPIDREKLYNAIDICKDQVMMERNLEINNKKLRESNKILTKQERELRENLQKTIALKETIGKSEENLRKIAENIQDAFFLGHGSKVLYANPAVETLFEVSAAEFYQKDRLFLEFIHPDDKEEFVEKFEKHEQKPGKLLSAEFRIVSKSGKIKNIWFRDLFIDHEKNSDQRRICTLSDISWRIENEKLQQDLTVAERSAQIKHRLLANVSHEIRTPLNGIFAMAEILSGTKLNHEQKEHLRTIQESADQLLFITNNLLDIHELENADIKINAEPVKPRKIFKPLFQKYHDIASKKGLSFSYDYEQGFAEEFLSDSRRLVQVLEQLIMNAIKFTSEGNIQVKLSSKETDENNLTVTMEVKDSGIGIKDSYMKEMFQLFSQQESSDKRSFEGLGLGLNICSKIATLMNGEIKVESEEGKGSTFRFIFPAAKTKGSVAGSEAQEDLAMEAIPQLNLSVLCVEDKEVNQKVLTLMLNNAGCTVECAPNGLEALKMYESRRPYDIILMDIQMPVMDGLTATKELKKKYNDLPPVIGVSANALESDSQYYISQGLDDYIAKPVSPKVLYERILSWTGKDSRKRNGNNLKPLPEETTLDPRDLLLLPDLDTSGIDAIKEQTKQDDAVINELYSIFIMEADTLIQSIDDAIAENRDQELLESTHALKGMSATIGAAKIAHIATEMDKLHKQQIFKKSEPLFNILKKDYETVKSLIREKFLSNP